MYAPIFRQIGQALKTLNPNEVRELADRPTTVGVLAADDAVASMVFEFLVPDETPDDEAREAGKHILRVASDADFDSCDLGFAEAGVPHPAHFYRFDEVRPSRTLKAVIEDREGDWLALARRFPGLREAIVDRIIWRTCKENSLFTVATAVPNVVPSWIMLPWAVGEFASDTAFLTGNQVRMAFFLAAAENREIGYSEQKGQIASIIAAAFGWRALARQLVGKIPAGGGLLSKGLVSFAGTYAVGKSLDQFFRCGDILDETRRRAFYEEAYERGREVVRGLIERVRPGGVAEAAAPSSG